MQKDALTAIPSQAVTSDDSLGKALAQGCLPSGTGLHGIQSRTFCFSRHAEKNLRLMGSMAHLSDMACGAVQSSIKLKYQSVAFGKRS